MRSRRAAGALVLGWLAIASFPAPADAKRARHACRLLTPTEIIATLAAGDVADGEKGDIPDTCQFEVDGGPQAGGGLIATALVRGSDAKESFELARDLAGGDLVEIEDLGRKAFFAIDTVFVLHAKRSFFYVQGLFPDATSLEGELQADLEALALIAAERV